MKIFISGGGGFIGSNVAEFYARQGHDIVVLDNLSRAKLLKQDIKSLDYNMKFLQQFKNVKFILGNVAKMEDVLAASKDADVFFHLAAQTAVTTSVTDPEPDFQSNALGTFNVMEAARRSAKNPAVIYSSTNKVYGSNPNSIGIVEKEDYYEYEQKFAKGIPESFSIDHCEHTPYGCSKLAGDLYAQDYAHVYGLKTGVFRMSCIYGTRQFGVEDQGWVAWFTIATILGKPITIFGDGKQVRDVLFVKDLIELYNSFLESKLKHGVFNAGGGPENTMSLLQLLDSLEKLTGKRSSISYSDWRPSDQKVFIADIAKAHSDLGWKPKISPSEGVKRLVDFVDTNKNLF